jgi:hypothetical protein
MLDLATVTHEDFEACLNQRFAIKDGEHDHLELELVEVEPRAAAGGQARAPFSLLFRGPVEPVLSQAIRAVSNDALGAMELFLVPVSGDTQGTLYEAVFN